MRRLPGEPRQNKTPLILPPGLELTGSSPPEGFCCENLATLVLRGRQKDDILLKSGIYIFIKLIHQRCTNLTFLVNVS